jgi:methyltransferase (TIGR00027 family)
MARTTGWNVMVDFLACRTAYFDEMVTKAAQPGVRQFVIICAGLDSRAWRLNWPDSSTVYEMDQPSVLRFKSDGLGRSEAQTLCEYLEVGIDLRMDWPNTLQATVFKAAEPTAWIAEGLMPYLPAAAQDSLFDHILQLSALGCWIGVEALPVDVPHSEHYALAAAAQQPAPQADDTADLPKVGELFYFEERTEPSDLARGEGLATQRYPRASPRPSIRSRQLAKRRGTDSAQALHDGPPSCLFTSVARLCSHVRRGP